MRPWALTLEQVEDLTAHLARLLAGDSLADAVGAIDTAAVFVGPVVVVMADGDELLLRRTTTPGAERDRRRRESRHMRAVAATITSLRRLLETERPLWGTAGVDWKRLDASLATIGEAGRIEGDALRPHEGRGRAPDEFLDDLISVIHGVYPPGAATLEEGSHFVTTVELVLAYRELDVKEIRSRIVGALRRRPEPPFRMMLTRPPTN